MAEARIYLVRHGETEENKTGVIQGQLDTALNHTGEQQVSRVANSLGMAPFEIAYTSDLVRATDTAKSILRLHPNGVALEEHSALRERYMGKVQGVTWADRKKFAGEDLGMESNDAFALRVTKWWEEFVTRRVAELAPRCMSYHILVTTHGGVIQTLIRALMKSGKLKTARGVSVSSSCLNTSVTVLEMEKTGRGTMVMFADVTHLKGESGVQENVDSEILEQQASS